MKEYNELVDQMVEQADLMEKRNNIELTAEEKDAERAKYGLRPKFTVKKT